jgi:DNA (cytosine-5)-methyltransferase 1
VSKLKVLDLFSGIGGFSLGLERTGGFETVAFCEIDPFCQKVLKKHWPDVPIYNDVRTLEHDGPVDVITGGFPCQPFSTAGKRKGADDDRHLWPAMLSLIEKQKPSWVIGENVAGFASMGFIDREPQLESKAINRSKNKDHFEMVFTQHERMLLDYCCENLEAIGYEVQPLLIPACGVDAKHERFRIWILAYSESAGERRKVGDIYKENGRQGGALFQQPNGASEGRVLANAKCGRRGQQLQTNAARQSLSTSEREKGSFGAGSGSQAISNTNSQGLSERHVGREPGAAPGSEEKRAQSIRAYAKDGWRWPPEPRVGRVAHGISNRVDRLKGLGNAVVPQIPEMIGHAILEARAS